MMGLDNNALKEWSEIVSCTFHLGKLERECSEWNTITVAGSNVASSFI